MKLCVKIIYREIVQKMYEPVEAWSFRLGCGGRKSKDSKLKVEFLLSKETQVEKRVLGKKNKGFN